jgi:hypothetical protein
MRAYADALHGDAGGLEQLRRALEVARERQHEAVAALSADAGSVAWSLHGSLLADAARLLREMDPDTGPHTEALARTLP